MATCTHRGCNQEIEASTCRYCHATLSNYCREHANNSLQHLQVCRNYHSSEKVSIGSADSINGSGNGEEVIIAMPVAGSPASVISAADRKTLLCEVADFIADYSGFRLSKFYINSADDPTIRSLLKLLFTRHAVASLKATYQNTGLMAGLLQQICSICDAGAKLESSVWEFLQRKDPITRDNADVYKNLEGYVPAMAAFIRRLVAVIKTRYSQQNKLDVSHAYHMHDLVTALYRKAIEIQSDRKKWPSIEAIQRGGDHCVTVADVEIFTFYGGLHLSEGHQSKLTADFSAMLSFSYNITAAPLESWVSYFYSNPIKTSAMAGAVGGILPAGFQIWQAQQEYNHAAKAVVHPNLAYFVRQQFKKPETFAFLLGLMLGVFFIVFLILYYGGKRKARRVAQPSVTEQSPLLPPRVDDSRR